MPATSTPQPAARNNHPSSVMLALFARKDLPWRRRFNLGRHINGCSACQEQIKLIRDSTLELRREAASETLTSFEAIADWSRLEREMLGNIAVGVAAARCIDHVNKRRWTLLPAAFAAGLALLFALSWTTHVPKEQTQHLVRAVQAWWAGEGTWSGTVLRTSPLGIAVRSHGTTLTLMHPRTAMVSMSGGSSVEARFIDEASGQVTITNVYGE